MLTKKTKNLTRKTDKAHTALDVPLRRNEPKAHALRHGESHSRLPGEYSGTLVERNNDYTTYQLIVITDNSGRHNVDLRRSRMQQGFFFAAFVLPMRIRRLFPGHFFS